MRRASAFLLLGLAGCFSARGGVERYHAKVHVDMDQRAVRKALGKPREIVPIPGQGALSELPVEQWRYWWGYKTGLMLTAFFTLGVGMIWMDTRDYGFDVSFDRDGKVRGVSEVAVPR
ncbi:MAG TPA: hypothetical protein VF950_10970 [Planctomycetota bacterium]